MLRFPDAELPLDHPDRALLDAIAKRLEVSIDRVALIGSMSDLIHLALEETPQVRDPRRQQALTDKFLAPALSAFETLLLNLRAELDPVLRRARPTRSPGPYPIGRCLEITKAVQQRLDRLDLAGLSGSDADACRALRDFREAGGEVRRAWGDLRGEYFQNALIVGTLYVDVSNDSVVTTKPPVQILPFAEANFKPILEYDHFARIARRYWRYRFMPNHILPQLAPYLPLIQVGPDGRLSLGPSSRYMLGLTLAKAFLPSEQALAAPALPQASFEILSDALRGGPFTVAASPEEGRESALACCRRYRAQARFDCGGSFNGAMAAARTANQQMAKLVPIRRAA